MQFKAVGGVRINVAVLAYDDKVLWDCRNFLYDFIDKTNYNLGITLTKDSSVIFHGMKFVPGGLDLILVSDHYGEEKYEEFVKTVTKTLRIDFIDLKPDSNARLLHIMACRPVIPGLEYSFFPVPYFSFFCCGSLRRFRAESQLVYCIQ